MVEVFERILCAHLSMYPAMEPQDVAKLCYQSEYGPEHVIDSPEGVRAAIEMEWRRCRTHNPWEEDIGGGLCRFHLGGEYSAAGTDMLSALLFRTAREHTGSQDGLEEKLRSAELALGSGAGWFAAYRQAGCPPVHHSNGFREAYDPHYRLLKKEYARYMPVLAAIAGLAGGDGPALVSIDGRCGSGKSGFAALAAELLPCNLLHTDDFYLPADMRGLDWQRMPGGNMDFERLRSTLLSLLRGEAVEYAAYDCQNGRMKKPVAMEPKPIVLLEGSYSHHPALDCGGMKVFLDCSEEERKDRLIAREGDYYPAFERTWMPMEELYISAFDIGSGGLRLDTGGLF